MPNRIPTFVAAVVVACVVSGCATKVVHDAQTEYATMAKAVTYQPMYLLPGAAPRVPDATFPKLEAYPGSGDPMFDDMAKNAEHEAADAAFLAAAKKGGFANDSGSDRAVENGWLVFANHDLAAAARSFNEAWLLDPENGNAYDGFAVIVATREQDSFRAENFFKGGLAKRHSVSILLNYGVFLIKANRPADAVAPLRDALRYPEAEGSARALLVVAYAGSGNAAAACTEAPKISDKAMKTWRDAARSFAAKICVGS
jgi:hypothetical protein